MIDTILGGNQLNDNNIKYDINKYRITHESDIDPIIPVILIALSTFAAQGDISFVTGQAKAGKTAISVYMLATALMEEIPTNFDTLQIKTSYAYGKPVVYIDTEQKDAYTNKLRQRVCAVMGVEKEPDNLYIYNLRKVPRKSKLKEVINIIGGLRSFTSTTPHLIIIDGMADLVSDPNQTEESFDVIDQFMILADELKTTIIGYIHENPNSTRVRGHMGSEAERKCGGFINVRKDKGIHFIESRMMKGSADFEKIPFHYCKEKDRMVSLQGDEVIQFNTNINKEALKIEKLIRLGMQCFPNGDHIRHKELMNRIMRYGLTDEGKKLRQWRQQI